MIPPMYTLGVLGAVCDNYNILIVKTVYGGARWQLPGGYVEKHEDVRRALCREVKEELGVNATIIAPIGTYIRIYDSNIVLLFEIQIPNVPLKLQKSEISQARYYSLENLPSNMSNRTRIMIDDAIKKKRGQVCLFTSMDDVGTQLG